MFNHVMFVDSNQHCALCLNCVRTCPNGSPQLNVRMPGRELWNGLTARPETGRFVAMLAGLLLAQMLIQHWETPTAGPRTIMVPLDGSELCECALGYAIQLGALFGSGYHLTRIVPVLADIQSRHEPYAVQLNRTLRKDAMTSAADYLEQHASRMRWRGLKVTTSVALGQPGHEILCEADAVGCDLIVMATHGCTGLHRVVLGSAADKVLRGTNLPVMLYRPARVPAQAA